MREGLRGLNKEEVKLATEISIEIGIAEAPTLIFIEHATYLGICVFHLPLCAEYCIISPSEFIELTVLEGSNECCFPSFTVQLEIFCLLTYVNRGI